MNHCRICTKMKRKRSKAIQRSYKNLISKYGHMPTPEKEEFSLDSSVVLIDVLEYLRSPSEGGPPYPVESDKLIPQTPKRADRKYKKQVIPQTPKRAVRKNKKQVIPKTERVLRSFDKFNS